jgi:hypothetical protein
VRRLFLHVGLPKTGTSALQRYLWNERTALAAQGLTYPDATDPVDRKQAVLVPDLVSGSGGRLIAEWLQDRDGDVVVSHEGLSNHLVDFSPDALERFRGATRAWEVHVVLVTRDPEPWITSYHRQCVLNPPKGLNPLSGTAAPREAIAAHPRVELLTDHARLAASLKRAFGATDVTRVAFEDPDWVAQVFAVLGQSAPVALPRVNDSVPGWMAEILRRMNGADPRGWLGWRQAAQAFLGTGQGILASAAAKPPGAAQFTLLREMEPAHSWTRAEAEAAAAFRDFATGFRSGDAAG